jgi:hypothetical protein
MKLKAIIIGALLLLSILSISAVPSIGISLVSAYQGSGVFCPNNYVPDQWPWDTPDEVIFSTQCCYYISTYLTNHYYGGQNLFVYGDPIWYSVPPVTASTYMDYLDYLEDYSDAVTIFSKGHCTPWGYGGMYRQLLCTYDEVARDSIEIYPHTDQFKCRFDFIWHCGTANTYPYWPPFPPDGPPGMPFAFTHNIGMTEYGYSGPCVFVGWDYDSPQFYNVIPDHYPWQWGQLAVGIFYYMHTYYLDLGYTLNYMANQIYGNDFEYTPLYNDLIVWGNMDMALYY